MSWRVLVGDARETIEGVPGWCDIIFFDPFSPEANPALWTVDFLRSLRTHTNDEGGLVVTYSSATPTRVSFLLAGFFVGQGISTGTRTETTNAATQLESLEAPLGERWLERWKRSSARGAHGISFNEAVSQAVLEHPQFASQLSAGGGHHAHRA
jgi:spermidine synthase